jgi:hypothetical protein
MGDRKSVLRSRGDIQIGAGDIVGLDFRQVEG